MMKLVLSLIVFLCLTSFNGQAQKTDTLSNLPDNFKLYAPKYTNPGQWGYVLGQNSSYRQQFAEKYSISGSAKINGLVTHLTGTYKNPDNYVEFNIYSVAENGLPGSRLGGIQIYYKDLDLSGDAQKISFPFPVTVKDSFFVTFNVMDYLHGGYEGDTLGLMTGTPGSREKSDLENFGRNAVQAHNHNKEDWKDFYSQNFTPVATHFALFPVIERENLTGNSIVSKKQSFRIYPNPSSGKFKIQCPDQSYNSLMVTVLNISGNQVFKFPGESTIDLSFLNSGIYILKLESKNHLQTFKISIK